ncbi:MAG: hypothetical protein ABSG31_01670 [Tepidisphaeraceae bacterium]|jgi:hypothetical protein
MENHIAALTSPIREFLEAIKLLKIHTVITGFARQKYLGFLLLVYDFPMATILGTHNQGETRFFRWQRPNIPQHNVKNIASKILFEIGAKQFDAVESDPRPQSPSHFRRRSDKLLVHDIQLFLHCAELTEIHEYCRQQ